MVSEKNGWENVAARCGFSCEAHRSGGLSDRGVLYNNCILKGGCVLYANHILHGNRVLHGGTGHVEAASGKNRTHKTKKTDQT